MRILALSIFIVFFHIFLFSQDTISFKEIDKYTSYFKIEDGKLKGAGADLLKTEFSESQFVLLGEYHGDAMISKFTEAIIPELAENDFKYFGVEVGPHSAKKLMRLSEENKTVENLYHFNNDASEITEEIPIPFF